MASEKEEFAAYRQSILKESDFLHRLRWAIPSGWSLAADALGVTSIVLTLLIAGVKSAEAWIASTFLALIAISAILAALVAYRRTQRTTRFAHATRSFHTAVHIIRNEIAAGRKGSTEVRDSLQEVLGAIAVGFSILTNTPCRACVKVIRYLPPPEGDVPLDGRIQYSYATTLCRDFMTARQLGYPSEGPRDAPVQHNTAFAFLFSDIRVRWFFGNDLPALMHQGRYNNTSITNQPAAKEWSLPYRSTVVWPIRWVTEHPKEGMTFTGKQRIIGYLAVDSPVPRVFADNPDFEVGALLADALYMYLDTLPTTDQQPQLPMQSDPSKLLT